MNIEDINKKSCSNCKFFRQHYVKFKTYYQKIGCGHCVSSITGKGYVKGKKYPYLYGCEFWEPVEGNEADRRQAVENSLIHMSERINDILEILKDEHR